MFKVPSSVIRNARKGLELRKFYKRGGTEVGEASARKLASGSISEAFAKHVLAYFPRHAGDNLEQTEKSAKGPSNGYIAWLLWGGSEARDWLTEKLKTKENPMDASNLTLWGLPKLGQDWKRINSGEREYLLKLAEYCKADNVELRLSAKKPMMPAYNGGYIATVKGNFKKVNKKQIGELVWSASGRENPKKNPFFMDAFHAGEAFQKDKSANRTPRYASFAEWWKFKGSKDVGAKVFDSEDAKDFWIMGVNSAKKKSKNPKKPSSKAGLPANASAQQINAKLKQLSHLKAALENKGTRKDFIKAERIAQQMKALALKHQKVLGLQSGLKANPSYDLYINGVYWGVADTNLLADVRKQGHVIKFVPQAGTTRIRADATKKRKSVKKNPSLKRGLKAIGKTVSGRVSKITKRIGSKLKKLTPSGRRSTAAIKRLQEASKGDPLGKTKRMILDARKASSSKKNPADWNNPTELANTYIELGGSKSATPAQKRIYLNRIRTSMLRREGITEDPQMPYEVDAVLSAAVKRLASIKRNPKPKRKTKSRQAYAYKRKPFVKATKRKRNSAAASSALYEQFHGKPSTSILEIEEEWHIHKHLAQLGTLVEIKVLLNPTESKSNQRRATLAVPHSDSALKGVQLCSSEGKGSKTLYLIGGDQSLPLKALGFTAADEKDLMYIGEIEEITYRTRKHFDQFKKIDYYHGLGEVSKVRPQLLYRSRDKKLLIAGGQYDVRPEGIVN